MSTADSTFLDFRGRKLLRTNQLSQPQTLDYLKLKTLQAILNIPLVSVVLPVYNHAEFVTAAIQSVLIQNIDLELIIVNDGSTDNLEEILAPFLNDSRVIYIRQTNSGISQALNAGFARSRGAFLTWTSADNIYLAGALIELTKCLLLNPGASLAFANVELIDESGEKILGSNYRASDQVQSTTSTLELPRDSESLFYLDDNFINSCFMYRRSFAKLTGDYRKSLNGAEDYDYWLRLSAFSPAVHIDSDKPFYQYRLHQNSLTGSLNASSLVDLTREIRIQVSEVRKEVTNQLLSNSLKTIIEDTSLEVSREITRARQGDFQSIAEISGKPNVGIISGSAAAKVFLHDLVDGDTANIVLFIEDQLFLDEVQKIAIDRKVKIFEDFPITTAPLSKDEYRNRSLMFFLSRLDFLLIPSWKSDSTNQTNPEINLQKLHRQAGFAASAGIELRVIKSGLLIDAANEKFQEHLDFSLLFLPALHVCFYHSLAECLSERLKPGFSREYLNKWLDSQSSLGITSLVRTALLQKHIQKRFPL